ncbi:MAG: DUF362 domain-containing protein [Deltaproteobacteria bacterium]|nr:DUF362 domain-containing protein [Deltaproteobacteria bacterium]
MYQKSRVSIRRAPSYESEVVYKAIQDCLEPLGGIGAFVQSGQRVLLKPNLLGPFFPETAVTTNPEVVAAVAKLCLEAGAKVSVGDSPGIGELRIVMKRAGLKSALAELDTSVADFSACADFESMRNIVGRKIALAKAVAEADVIISLPKLKTHSQMVFTGALKNQYGLVVGTRKAYYHYRLRTREWLAALMIDINRIARPKLAIMDGIIAMEGMGPSGGEPRHLGVLIAGADLAAVDVAACTLIGLDPESVPLNLAARKYEFGATRLAEIELVGDDLSSLVVPDFKKVPQLRSVLRILPFPAWFLSWLERKWAARPRIIPELCIRCNACGNGCPVEPAAIQPLAEGGPQVDDDRCIRCYCCHEFCPVKAIALKRSWLGKLLGT